MFVKAMRWILLTAIITGIWQPSFSQGESENHLNIPSQMSESLASYTVGEGYDFATRVLRDPWDMSEFTDINQWLNHTGPDNYLLNIQVQDGIFSAYASSGGSYFFTLYPGYDPGMNNGKIGRILPINSSLYSCFYLAMQAQELPTPAYD